MNLHEPTRVYNVLFFTDRDNGDIAIACGPRLFALYGVSAVLSQHRFRNYLRSLLMTKFLCRGRVFDKACHFSLVMLVITRFLQQHATNERNKTCTLMPTLVKRVFPDT